MKSIFGGVFLEMGEITPCPEEFEATRKT